MVASDSVSSGVPYAWLMPMQPRPSAETERPWRPSVREFMCGALCGVGRESVAVQGRSRAVRARRDRDRRLLLLHELDAITERVGNECAQAAGFLWCRVPGPVIGAPRTVS